MEKTSPETPKTPIAGRRLVDGKLLRCGYTTGTCAAAAAKAAAEMLLGQQHIGDVSITVPNGETLVLETVDASYNEESALCAIKKDSGDDPDITNGVLVYAAVKKIRQGIEIDGGEGIGLITKPGLDQPVGNAAINSVPRLMIKNETASICEKYDYPGGLSVVISIPGGDLIAKRTFNPRLGIEGGLSILGTSGIVEPMSNAALIDSIRLELQIIAAAGEKKLLLTIGNFGERFAKEILELPLNNQIKCGNFIGNTLAAAAELGFKQIILVGHIGKLVKLGLGITNTHSSNVDGRSEMLIACALRSGADMELLHKLDDCVTTESAVELLRETGLLRAVMENIGENIQETLMRHVLPDIEIGYVCFIDDEVLTKSGNAEKLMDSVKWAMKNEIVLSSPSY